MTRTRLLGGRRIATERLPTIIAGRAALKIEAVKLITAKKRIKSRIPRLSLRYRRPLLADCNTVSLPVLLRFGTCGIWTKHSNAMNAVANVIKSNRITNRILVKESIEVASKGVSMVTNELDKERIPLIF
ncbi:hypothetical protein D3C80_1604780 [compost metagenome]